MCVRGIQFYCRTRNSNDLLIISFCLNLKRFPTLNLLRLFVYIASDNCVRISFGDVFSKRKKKHTEVHTLTHNANNKNKAELRNHQKITKTTPTTLTKWKMNTNEEEQDEEGEN